MLNFIKKSQLDLSSIQLDGSHTPTKRGGQTVDYQGKNNKRLISNGLPLAMSTAVSGNHNDLFEIKDKFSQMLCDIQAAEIATKGLFMNADARFDSSDFRNTCKENEIIANIDFNKLYTQKKPTLFQG